MNVIFLGATKGMGRALSRRMAERGDRLFLMGRNVEELRVALRDLDARSPGSENSDPESVAPCDLLDGSTFASAFAKAEKALPSIDTVVVTAGVFGTQEQIEADSVLRDQVLMANFVGTIQFCEEARRHLLARGGGRLCVFSSVAGERGRKPVVIYGATKAGLTKYLDGLDARYHAAGLRVILVKPGFVRTGMTEGLDPPPFAGEVESVAEAVLRAIDKGQAEVYVPGIWRWVMTAIRLLPKPVMRKVKF